MQKQKRSRPVTLAPERMKRQPLLILVIDDDRDTCEMYAQYCRHVGFRAITATDGDSGILMARRYRPVAIVMDLTMHPTDGWEATRRLKNGHWTTHIPIIACTGQFLGQYVERALEAGCDAYLVKPCLPEDLVREIRKVLARPARQAQA
jgi:two-component system cell cycle response regulator DivK